MIRVAKFIGVLLGCISKIVPTKLDYFFYVLKRNFCTVRNKSRFKRFGENSLLAPGCKLYRVGNFSIGKNTSIMSDCVLEGDNKGQCIIGDGVSLGEYSHITCANRIVIGDGLLTGRFVLITDNGHGRGVIEERDIYPLAREVYSKGEIVIGKNVWLGDKVTILPGVHLGDNVIVGANSVVTRDFPSDVVIAGNPAQIIKQQK